MLAVIPELNVITVDDDYTTTRSSLSWNGGPFDANGGMGFTWDAADRIVVFPQGETASTRVEYTLRTGANTTSAYFTADGFNLTPGQNYYSISPLVTGDNMRDLTITYKGQRQTENASTSHLGAYDFLASAGTCTQSGFVRFDFKRLSTILRIRVGGLEGKTFTNFALRTADNYDFKYVRHLDLTNEDASLTDYSPELVSKPGDPTNTDNPDKLFEMALGPEKQQGNAEEQGITVGSAAGSLLVLHMMVPATMELDGKSLFGVLTEKGTGNKFYIAVNGTPYNANAVLKYGKKASKGDKLSVSVVVNKDWQHGNTKNEEITRAVGDPGKDEVLDNPDRILVYVFKNDKFLAVYDTDNTSANGEFAGWTELAGNKISYKKTIEIDLGGALTNTDVVKAYVYAVKGDLTTTPVSMAVNDPTSNADGMTFSFTSSDQDFLKNVYSYDYTLADYKVPIINAEIFHSAAKLDVQWNSTTKLTGSVSVNNLYKSGIKMFQQVNNPTTSGSWAPSITLNEGNCYNGRAVFYVPQKSDATYNITVGDQTQNVVFTPETSDHKTSWLKTNITIK